MAGHTALTRGISAAVEKCVEQIAKQANPINEKSKSDIRQVATIAGNNDPSIGKVLSTFPDNQNCIFDMINARPIFFIDQIHSIFGPEENPTLERRRQPSPLAPLP